MDKIEFLVLKNLLHNEEYLRKTVPFIKAEYFEDYNQKVVFEEILDFVSQYNETPTKEVLSIEIEKRSDINEDTYKELIHLVDHLDDQPVEYDWLVNTTEKWCRDRAIYLALLESISIADGNVKEKAPDAIPSILSDALAVSFDSHVGHDYLLDYEDRYKFYNTKEDKIPFDLEFFNKITKGGLPNKTLNIALAGTGVGKSLFMCHVASACLLQNKNVLYITMEMSEEKIAERIDANLLNTNIQDIADLPKQMFETKVNNLSQKTQGSLIIKEYPTASAHCGHFKGLLNELHLRNHLDLILFSLITLIYVLPAGIGQVVMSIHIQLSKLIAEELRGLSCKQTSLSYLPRRPLVLVMVALMLKLTDTSESFGLPATADLMFALISTDEAEGLGQILVKQLKNRYNDLSIYKRFVVGIDRAKMRLFDCEQSAQDDILDSKQEEEYTYDEKPKKSFDGFKF